MEKERNTFVGQAFMASRNRNGGPAGSGKVGPMRWAVPASGPGRVPWIRGHFGGRPPETTSVLLALKAGRPSSLSLLADKSLSLDGLLLVYQHLCPSLHNPGNVVAMSLV